MSVGDSHTDAPPAGEEIHLPGPSSLPFVMSIGITAVVVGTTINWLITIVGAVIFLYTLVRWVLDTRRDIDALPETHAHPH